MKVWWIGLCWLSLTCTAQAAEVTLRLSDSALSGILNELCTWWLCKKDDKTYASEAAMAQWLGDRMVQVISMGHHQSLGAVGATLEVRHEN